MTYAMSAWQPPPAGCRSSPAAGKDPARLGQRNRKPRPRFLTSRPRGPRGSSIAPPRAPLEGASGPRAGAVSRRPSRGTPPASFPASVCGVGARPAGGQRMVPARTAPRGGPHRQEGRNGGSTEAG
jgi:hypothetical protein